MRLLLLAIVGLTLSACAPMTEGEAGDDEGGQGGMSELWYNFEINRPSCTDGFCKPGDVEVCSTKQSFYSPTDYCRGLRNSSLNKDCARRERKERYLRECGSGFEDVSIAGWKYESGGIRDESAFKVYPTRRDLCLDVNNHAAHKSATYDMRRALASRFECN